MARVIDCDFNDTDFPQGGSHPAGVAWDWNIDGGSVNSAGLTPQAGIIGGGANGNISVGGEYPKITSAASRRAGHKGFRFYLNDGSNVSNGGLGPEAASVNLSEFYFRWYMRTSVAWSFPDNHYWKLWRIDGANPLIIGISGGHPVGGNRGWGVNIFSADIGAPLDVDGGISWFTSQGDSFVGDGNWHAYEVHCKENSNPSTADGIFEFWFDGVQKKSVSNVAYASGSSSWGAFYVSNQAIVTSGVTPVDITDIVMDDSTYIGPIGGTSLSLSRSRVRNDNGSQTTATYRYAEDQFLVSNSDENFRLRIQIDDVVGSYKYRLEYKLSTDTAWSVVGTSGAIKLAASSNIATGGEATTAQLTAPSGKTTSNFTAGRMWDDENGLDTITIASGEYTELEWCLQFDSGVTSPLQNYQFRVSRS